MKRKRTEASKRLFLSDRNRIRYYWFDCSVEDIRYDFIYRFECFDLIFRPITEKKVSVFAILAIVRAATKETFFVVIAVQNGFRLKHLALWLLKER